VTGQFDVQVGEADLLAAYRAHYPLFPKVRIAIGALFVLLFGVGIALLDKPGDARFAAVFAGALLLLMAFLLVVIQLAMRLWWMPRYTRRIYSQQVDLRTPFTISWDEERLSTVSTIGSGIATWGDFHRWLRTDDLLLIYRSEALFHIVPLHDIEAQSAADTIVARLKEAGVPEKRST
jgi:hypothetical protein